MTNSLLYSQAPAIQSSALVFGTPSDSASIVSLSVFDAFAGKYVLLLFYPLNFTATAATELTALSDRILEFEGENCQVVGVSCDSAHSHYAWSAVARDQGGLGPLSFPLVSDFDKTIAKSYGVLRADGTAARSTFLVSPAGIIRFVGIHSNPTARNVDELLRMVKLIQKEEKGGEPDPIHGETYAIADNADARYPSAETSWRYSDLLVRAPVTTKAITSCAISILGEVIGTFLRQEQSAESIFQRLCVFGSYGLVITGPFFHWWYGALERVVSSWSLSANLAFAVKLALNQLVMTPPFLLFTLAYLNYFMLLDYKKTITIVKRTFAAALFTNWKVWTVAQAVNFSVVPLQYRVLFGNIVALWWNVYLSLVAAHRSDTV